MKCMWCNEYPDRRTRRLIKMGDPALVNATGDFVYSIAGERERQEVYIIHLDPKRRQLVLSYPGTSVFNQELWVFKHRAEQVKVVASLRTPFMNFLFFGLICISGELSEGTRRCNLIFHFDSMRRIYP